MIPTIVIAGILVCLVALAMRKCIRDFKARRCCGHCSGCTGEDSCGIK